MLPVTARVGGWQAATVSVCVPVVAKITENTCLPRSEAEKA